MGKINRFGCWTHRWPLSIKCLLAGIAAIGIRIWAYWQEGLVSRDGCSYLKWVRKWHESGSFSALIEEWPQLWFPPLPLYLMYLPFHFGSPIEIAGVAASMAAGSILPLIIFLLARELRFSRKAAWIAVFFTVIHPELISLSIQPQRESSYLLCASLALWQFAKYHNDSRWKNVGGFGFWSGCSILCRYEGWEFILFFTAYGLWQIFRRKLFCVGLMAAMGIYLVTLLATIVLGLWLIGDVNYMLNMFRYYIGKFAYYL